MPFKLHLKLLLALLWAAGYCSAMGPGAGAPAIPASPNVTQLNEFTFQGRMSDGRVWFVEFYADWCRGCMRIASHVSMLADNLTASAPHIVVARLDCDAAESFCNDVIRIDRTPTFKVYHNGKYAITYRSDFYFFDMMHAFITRVAGDILGLQFSPPPGVAEQQQKQQQQQQEGAGGEVTEEEDDEYDDGEDDAIIV